MIVVEKKVVFTCLEKKKSPSNGGQYATFNAVTIQFCANKKIARK